MAKKSTVKALDAKLDAKIVAEQQPVLNPDVQQVNAKYGVACTIAIDRIEVKRNTRKHFDEAGIAELARTIGEVGILQPLVVRAMLFDDLTDSTTKFELVAGERRLRAARLAGLTEVPASVRWLTDRQTLEIQVLENLHRQDINPADEAEALAELLAASNPLSPAWTVEELAHRLGRTPQFIAQRAHIGRNLGAPLLDWLREGRLTIGAATVLARLPHLDAGHAADYFEKLHGSQHITSSNAVWYSDQHTRDLDRAPFSLDAPDLNPDRPGLACTICPERAKAQHHLFPELVDATGDRCLTPGCYATKVATHLALAAARIEQQTGAAPLRVSTHWSTSLDDTLPCRSFEQVTPDTPGAVPAMIVEGGATMGEAVFVLMKESTPAARSVDGAAETKQRKKVQKHLHTNLFERVRDQARRGPAWATSWWLDAQLMSRLVYTNTTDCSQILAVDFGLLLDKRHDDEPPWFAGTNRLLFHSAEAMVWWRELATLSDERKLELLARIDLEKLGRWDRDQYEISDELRVCAARFGLDFKEERTKAEAECTPKGKQLTAPVGEEGGQGHG